MTNNLSPRQTGTLRYVDEVGMGIEEMRTTHQGTLWSLLHRGYLRIEDNHVKLSAKGVGALGLYTDCELSARKVDDDLTARCKSMLKWATSRSKTKAA